MNNAETQPVPFEKDMLGRKTAADFLTRYLVGRHRVAGSVPGNESFVLNVNAEWGLGKTYFLTEWAKMLRSAGHPVVLFDAWENDSSSNPFVGFMAEVERQLSTGTKLKQKARAQASKVIKKGARVIRASAPTIGFALVRNFTGLDAEQLLEAAKSAAPDITSAIKQDLEKENKDLRAAISEFKNALAEFALTAHSESGVSLPVFLMVDELDRCRPSYAIELLENIKHVFRVPNVYTVVATDSEQLSHSIRAVYGAEFDSRKYLRRFFDHESRLDEPKFLDLVTALMTVRSMPGDARLVNPLAELYNHGGLAEIFTALAEALKITTRDLERSVDIIDSIRITASENTSFDAILLTFLTMLYVSHRPAFDSYTRNHVGNDLKQMLEPFCRKDVYFQESTEVGGSYHSIRSDKACVIDWVCRYIDGIWSEKPYQNEAGWLGLRYAIQGAGRSGDTLTRFRNYHHMVQNAGHFSV